MKPVNTHGPLAGPLRARVNQLAHSYALQYELRLKASLLEQVQTARSGGASFADLAELVGKLEAATPCGVDGRPQIQPYASA